MTRRDRRCLPPGGDLDARLEQAQADGAIGSEDADTVRDFAAFLRDPTGRCALCLQPGHVAADCPS